MRVVVDVTALAVPRTGIGNYTRGMLAGLVEAGAEVVAFTLIGRSKPVIEAALGGLAVERRLVRVPPRAHAWRTVWSRLGGPAVERLAGSLDVFHFSDWMQPPQRGGVRATTVFDLGPLHFPDWVAPVTRRMHGRKYRAARGCDVVFGISEFTAADAAETIGLPRERVLVAYPGVDAGYVPEGERASFGAPYVLGVATDEKRKNLGVLVDAMRILRGRGSDLQLVLAGGAGWGAETAREASVRRLGYVADDRLPGLYRGAAVFCYPSRFEGFGMPVVEALACGTPVVCSSHPSLDEAAGGVALRADPESPEAVAAAIDEAAGRADSLREPGLRHAARFTWRACGDAVLAGYREAL